MTITKDTDLSEILLSDDIINEMTTLSNNLQGLMSDRTSILQSEMTSGNGIGETQLVDGEPLFFTKGTEVSTEYGNITETLTAVNKSICATSIEKERDELTELRICLLKDNQNLADNLSAHLGHEVVRINTEPENGDPVVKAAKEQFNANNLKIIDINGRIYRLKDTYANYSDEELDIRYHYKPRYQGGNDCDNTTDGGENKTTDKEDNKDPKNANPTDAEAEKTNNGEYAIDTDGKDADAIYDQAKDLQTNLTEEMNYLSDYEKNIYNDIDILNSYHNSGKISDETYNSLKADYEAKLAVVQSEYQKRSDCATQLNALTINNFGTHDGALKDAADGNDTQAAQNAVYGLNDSTSKMRPLSEIAQEKQADGSVRCVAYAASDGTGMGKYQNNFTSIYDNTDENGSTFVPTSTMKAAYEVASNNGTAHETAANSGVYIYSSKDYFMNNPDGISPSATGGSGTGKHSEFDIVIDGIGTSGLNTNEYGDTVYDSNTGMYYSYDDWYRNHSGSKQ